MTLPDGKYLEGLSAEEIRLVRQAAALKVAELREAKPKPPATVEGRLNQKFQGLDEEQAWALSNIYRDTLKDLGAEGRLLSEAEGARVEKVLDRALNTFQTGEKLTHGIVELHNIKTQGGKLRISNTDTASLEASYYRDMAKAGTSDRAIKNVIRKYNQRGLKNASMKDLNNLSLEDRGIE